MRAIRVAQTAALLPAAWALALVLWVVARRIGYPYDLEWMEGGMLCHALRLLEHQPIYAPPSVDFIPHLYTPLYPALLAALGWATSGDVGYLLARGVSAASFALALASAIVLVRRAAGPLLPALPALALPLAAFPVVGGWYDLARSDSLQLGLLGTGAALAFLGRPRHATMAAAGLLLALAFLAKQTAAPLCAGIVAALLLGRRRGAWTLAVSAGGLFLASVYLLDRASGGWFWTYIFRLHQGHEFYFRRAYVETPFLLGRTLGPALLIVPLALLRGGHRSPGVRYLVWLGLLGILTACMSFGTQWAHVNAYIPGIFFPALAIGACAAYLQDRGLRREALLSAGLLGASLLLLLAGFRPAEHLPSPQDRRAGAALIERLRQAGGEILIPFHPFYGHLAGKRTYLHRMGVWDVRGTVAGPVRGLAEALVGQRFSLIVFDDKVEGTWSDWPGVLATYRIAERFAGPRVVEGARTRPALALVPISLDKELQ